jgi:thiosulfate/3-mercaptopyruvate sulfurtransferase
VTTDPILDPADLGALEDAQLLEVRWRLGTSPEEHHTAYLGGHWPGAIFVDLEAVGTGSHRPGAGRHPLPDPHRAARDLAALGVDLARPLVVLDDARGAVAARLWWLLDALGAEAYLLDGGLDALSGPRCTTPCSPEAAPLRAPAVAAWPPQLVMGVAELARRLGDASLVVLDARAVERYRGLQEPIDPRAGHIPGAVSLPLERVLAAGRFPSPDEARRLLEPLAGRILVASCGSGITACALVALARRAGSNAVLLEGSWSGWCEDPNRPACSDPCGPEIIEI